MATKPKAEDMRQAAADAANRAPPPMPILRGTRVETNLGVGLLRPGVGRLVQRGGGSQKCGTMVGQCYGYVEHPNRKDPKRMSYRFAGDFFLVTHDGQTLRGSECYLPSSIERSAKAVLDLAGKENSQIAPVFPFAVDVWCEEADGTPLNYRYVAMDIRPRDESNDTTLQLAYASGAIERPLPALANDEVPAVGSDVDPETGEVMPRTSAAA